MAHRNLTHPDLGANDGSYSIAKGNRLGIVGVLLMGIPISIVGLLMCCLGILPAVVLWQALFTGLYLALGTGSELPLKKSVS